MLDTFPESFLANKEETILNEEESHPSIQDSDTHWSHC